MNMPRRRWVSHATLRDSPLDAILSGTIMRAVSFLASTPLPLPLPVFLLFRLS
ncbi:hypothetical protein [Devosia soli]|uniref:hypothetical protein n=1 Tax=Devosia soli TaxID=361041 RepID=UPI001379155D|nr:hypothetical protein [Devosia soli]